MTISDSTNPLGDPLLTPPETMPGPGNPWLSCTGPGGSRGEDGAKPPAELDIDPEAFEEAGLNWLKFSLGVVLLTIGLALAIAFLDLVALLATAAFLLALPGFVWGVAVGLAAGGVASLIGAIDPAPIDHRRTVELPPARPIRIDPSIPSPLLEAMAHVGMAERLATAELDLIEHARAAGAAGDEEWYRSHMERLYRAQVHQGRELHQAAAALEAWGTDQRELLQKVTIDPEVSLRDRLSSLVALRPLLRHQGHSDAELNSLLLMSRLPGPLLPVLEQQTKAMIAKSDGTAAGLLEIATDRLARLKTVDKELFGIER